MLLTNNTIMIADMKGVSVIDIGSIIRIEAVNNYSKLFLADGRKILVSKVLKKMEEMLTGKGFTRIHRSHLVNTLWISIYYLNQLKIKLHNQEQLCISRRRGTDIRKVLAEQRAAHLINTQKIIAA